MEYSVDTFFMLKEGNKNDIMSREITLEDFLYITKEDSFIIRKILLGDQILQRVSFPKQIIDTAVDIIINHKSINVLNQLLEEAKVPLYSLIISPVSTCNKKYKELKKFKASKQIIISCTKSNLIKTLDLSKTLNKKIIIDGRNITLKEYEELLSNYNLDSLDKIDLQINYQDQSSTISIKELYQTAMIVDSITRQIEQYNLSPLEKIIYTYDMVKSRVYKECNENKDTPRDLNQVVQTDYTVCVGYSNLFTSILQNMGINAKQLISTKSKHQRSLVYIQDNKYTIDGVYVFDATFDSRKKDSYINNYNYFALLLNESEKDSPSDIYNTINLSFEDMLMVYNEDIVNRIDEIKEKQNQLKKALCFIKETNYDLLEDLMRTYAFASYPERNIVNSTYSRYVSKYNPQKISPLVFFNALYNTRIVEYYNGVVDTLDIEDLIEVTRDSYVSQFLRHSEIKDDMERIFKALEVDCQIHSILTKEISQKEKDIAIKKLNVKLLKLLRNNQK